MTDDQAKEISIGLINKDTIDISKTNIYELTEYLYWEFDKRRSKKYLGERDCFKKTIIPVLKMIKDFNKPDEIVVNISQEEYDSIVEINKLYKNTEV